MARTKYFGGVRAAEQTAAGKGAPLTPFDFDAIGAKGRFARLSSTVTGALLPLVYRFSRAFVPVMPLAGLVHITRDAQVREILSRPHDFRVPFGPEMTELAGGATFMLGLDGPENARLNAIMRGLMRREDADWIAAKSGQFAAALLDNSDGRIDVVQDLIKRVPAEIALRFFGLHCDDVDAFADWTIALSALLFADPYGKPEFRVVALNAARRLGAVIDDGIARAQRLAATGALPDDSLLARLVLTQAEHGLSPAEIRAMVMGMISGFVPTNTLAASNMLDVLLAHLHAMQAAKDAARAGDVDTMRAVVMEAGRMNPALAPGQFRYCPRDTTITVDGRARRIKSGSTLLVSTMSAMRDRRVWDRPDTFVLGREQDADLVFGTGPHACIGRHLAVEQISALFMALLAQDNLQPAENGGKLTRTGPYPRHRVMTYDSANGGQSMFLIIARVTGDKAAAEAAMAAMGHPAMPEIRAALDTTGVLHFASLAVIDAGDDGAFISMELSADGPIAASVRAIATSAEALLRPIFAHAALGEEEDFAAFLSAHVVEIHGKPRGATGLNYNGLGEFSVGQVAKQARFADFAGRVLRDYVGSEAARSGRPIQAMAHLRRVLRRDAELTATATPAQMALMEEAEREGFDAFALTTDAARLKLARHREVIVAQGAWNFLKSPDSRVIRWPLVFAFAAFCGAFWPEGAAWISGGLVMLGKALGATALLSVALVALFLARLRYAEVTEKPDTSRAPLATLRAIIGQENPPGYAQNHILAVGDIKPGPFRAFTHAFALWGIDALVKYWFRPGLIVNMGSIHFARWWRLPGTRKVCFYSNFDGSWESYLEDFITRARQGQTAAWSNWQGFPRTKFLIQMGAQDGDAFKQWVRTQQQLVPFWYARFPELSSDHKRMNGIIHTGIGLARTASEAEEWLACFGSMPRVANAVEVDEVQAIVFRGMKRLPYSAALAVRLPDCGAALGEWLSWISGRPMAALDTAEHARWLADGVVLPLTCNELGRERAAGAFVLSHALTVAFGDRALTGEQAADDTAPARDAAAAHGRAVFLALSAAGVAKFDAPYHTDENSGALGGFPYAFRMGMAARARVLGDAGEDAPAHWRWSDQHTEAMVMLYAASPDALTQMVGVHRALLTHFGGGVLHQTDCAPAWPDEERGDFEHFGYRDGISQPVIRGSTRSVKGVPARDVVEAGEFILGYKNGAGFMPPSPIIAPDDDVRGSLPVVAEADNGGLLSRYPDFGDRGITASPRDLGRNGSFLVIRELSQNVAGFETATADAAARLNAGGLSDLYRTVGQVPDTDWVKAKLMGRWPDGRALVTCPVVSVGGSVRENDFAYGEDDPQGIACPFGAHIRRTNPRDSKAPGDAAEQAIANRHRLLRRGRSYSRADGEKGLLFAALCTDLERQFEFVQQFWANAPAFHGLSQEPDPFIGADVTAADGGKQSRVFTIPTIAGPVQLSGLNKFVHVKAGGYFFLPSRSALHWFTERALYAPKDSA